jgi:hypothetical protein
MSSTEQIFDALERIDAHTADILASYLAVEVEREAFEDVIKTYGVSMIDVCDEWIDRLRISTVQKYVTEITKSADPDLAMAASTRSQIALDDALDVRDGLIVLVSKDDEIWADGRSHKVGRDRGGQFTRQFSEGEAFVGSWSSPDAKKRRGRRPAPETVMSNFDVDDRGGLSFKEGVGAEEQEKTKQYMNQVAEVDNLRSELKAAFGPDAEDMLDITVRLSDATGRSVTTPIPMSGDVNDMAWDPSMKAHSMQFGPSAKLQTEDPTHARDVSGRLALGQLPGVDLRMTDPKLIRSLGNAIGGSTSGAKEYDKPKLQRFGQTLDNLSAISDGIPGAGAISGGLRMASHAFGQSEAMRDPLMRLAFRMRGDTKEPDKALSASVQGDGMNEQEQAWMDSIITGKPSRLAGDRSQAVESKYKPIIAAATTRLDELKRKLDQETESPTLGQGADWYPKDDGSRTLHLQRQIADQERRIKEIGVKAGTELSRAKDNAGADQTPTMALPGPHRSMVVNAALTRLKAGEDGRTAVRGAQRDVAAAALLDQMIDRSGQQRQVGHLEDGTLNPVNLQRVIESVANGLGRGFPSEGIIIGEDGQVKTQAIGYGEDHYLPFDIGGYKNMSNGSYVRTRSLGGMTGEDVKALVLSNARAGSVVSGSGVFDMELDVSLRGTSRYNDKVFRMGEMYERILDEINSGAHYAVDLSPQEKADIRSKLRSNSRNVYGDNAAGDYKDAYDKAVVLARAKKMEFTSVDQARAEAEAKASWSLRRGKDVNSLNESDRDELDAAIKQGVDAARKAKIRELGINDEGYDVAMKTLQRYFPYYIKSVSHRSLEQLVNSVEGTDPQSLNARNRAAQRFSQSGSKDLGYRKPGTVPGPMKLRETTERQARETRSLADAKTKTDAGAVSSDGGGDSAPPKAVTPSGSAAFEQRAAPPEAVPAKDEDLPELDELRTEAFKKITLEYVSKLKGVHMTNVETKTDLGAAFSRWSKMKNDGEYTFDWLNGPVGSSDAGNSLASVFFLGTSQQQERAVAKLGQDANAREAVLSDSSVVALSKLLFENADPEEEIEITDALNDLSKVAHYIFQGTKEYDGAVTISNQFDTRPILLPELVGLNDDLEIQKLQDEEVASTSPVVRQAVVGYNGSEEETARLANRAVKAVKAKNLWTKVSEKFDDTTPEVFKERKFDEIFITPNSDNGFAVAMAHANGAQQVTNQDVQELKARAVDNPDLITDLAGQMADAAVVAYSLQSRKELVKWSKEGGDIPKVGETHPFPEVSPKHQIPTNVGSGIAFNDPSLIGGKIQKMNNQASVPIDLADPMTLWVQSQILLGKPV